MALQKVGVNVNFAAGLDTKTDPKQVKVGSMLALQNTIFQKGGLLQKRNGFGALADLPDESSTFLTTFKNNLTAIGTSINSYSQGSETWVSKGAIQRLGLATMPVARSSTNETASDSQLASNGFICVTYLNNLIPTFSILDSNTGETIIAPTVITSNIGTPTGMSKVFILQNYFVIVFGTDIGSSYHLQYIAVNIFNPLVMIAATDISTLYAPQGVSFDGVVSNNRLYLAWNGSDGGGAVRVTYITSSFLQATPAVIPGQDITKVSLAMDTDVLNLYITFTNSTNGLYNILLNAELLTIYATATITGESTTISNIISSAIDGLCSIWYELDTNYGYDSSIPTHQIKATSIDHNEVVGSVSLLKRSLGLASKAFVINDTRYFLTSYESDFQPSYFLLSEFGDIISKLAYSNGGGYLTADVPSVTIINDTAIISYLFRDLIESVNKTQGIANSAGVYAQTGVNTVTFDFDHNYVAAEIGANLHISGGILWTYDGLQPAEQGFLVWPDNVELTAANTGGSIDGNTANNNYYYQVIYEWTDLQGNIHRSAPSIPVNANLTTGYSASSNSITLTIPTLRLTYKEGVKINIYRWSVGQQNYYQVTTVAAPLLNDTSVDYVTFVDTSPDSTILGNSLLYTTGGVIENISAPGTSSMTLFKSRFFMVDIEDKNLIWYSKQVIEATPVEMSDLFTIYVAPTISAQGSTGDITALAALDDKLIIFKKDAIYYLTGDGPDNAGFNNDFSTPTFITSVVGCSNENSIVFTPRGLLFQSDKGIWLLGRDLSTEYLGAPVEQFNAAIVLSSINIPATNQVRITLDNNITLMYDYYYNQWGTFINIPAISSTIYEGLHTYIDVFGRTYQETPGVFLDGSRPVLISFTTGWVNLANLQGYQRAYYFYLLGSYITPHMLTLGIAYDYDPAILQSTTIMPDNFNALYGEDNGLFGDASPYGGVSSIEQWRVFLQTQKCQSFQITLTETYDASYGVNAGAGFTLSGLNLVVGTKKGYPVLKPSRSVG